MHLAPPTPLKNADDGSPYGIDHDGDASGMQHNQDMQSPICGGSK